MGRGILAAVLAACAFCAPAAASPPPPVVLYSQYDDILNAYVTSQLLLPGPNPADDEAADDFTVPEGTSWLITQVTIHGYHSKDLTRNFGQARDVMLPDGRRVIIGAKADEKE